MAEGEESVAGSLGLALAIIYATGLITTNTFLSPLGMTDFSLVKPKAIFTGAIVLGSLALIASGPIHFLAMMRERKPTKPKLTGVQLFITAAVEILIPLCLVVLLSWLVETKMVNTASGLLYRLSPFFDFKRSSASHEFLSSLNLAIQLYLMSFATFGLAIWSIRIYRDVKVVTSFPGMAVRLVKLTLTAAGVLLAVGWYIHLFCSSFYAAIPQTMGGGAPEEAQLIIQPDSVEDLKSLGLIFEDESHALTAPIMVFHQADDYLGIAFLKISHTGIAVMVPTARMLRLDRKIVRATVSTDKILLLPEVQPNSR